MLCTYVSKMYLIVQIIDNSFNYLTYLKPMFKSKIYSSETKPWENSRSSQKLPLSDHFHFIHQNFYAFTFCQKQNWFEFWNKNLEWTCTMTLVCYNKKFIVLFWISNVESWLGERACAVSLRSAASAAGRHRYRWRVAPLLFDSEFGFRSDW